MKSPLDIFKSIKFDLIPVKCIPEYKCGEVYYNLGTLSNLLDSDIIYSSIDLVNWYEVKGNIPKGSCKIRYRYTCYNNLIDNIKSVYPNLYNKLKDLDIAIDDRYSKDLQLIINEEYEFYYIELIPECFLVKF